MFSVLNVIRAYFLVILKLETQFTGILLNSHDKNIACTIFTWRANLPTVDLR